MIRKINLTQAIYLLVFIFIFALSLYLKLVPVLNNNFPFTMDQARDMLDIRAMVELKKPTLIGPTTSISGVFLGPFYYYFNLIPFVISAGDPATLVYWNISWYMIAAVVLLFFFYKQNFILGLISSLVLLMAPEFFYSSRFFWSANPMPYMTLFYFLSIFNFFRKPIFINSALVGLVAGLSMQMEAAFAVLFFPFYLIIGIIRRIGFRQIFASILAFSLTLLPQLFFEIRHDFIMTKTFLGELGGKSQILGEKLTLVETFTNHSHSFFQFSTGFFQIPPVFSEIIILISIAFLGFFYFRKKLDLETGNIFILSVGFVLFAFSFYMFYSFPLKGWYLLGLRIPYLFIIALFLTQLFKLKFPILKFFIIIFLGWSFITTFIDQSKFIPKLQSDRSTDKSTLRNELEAIDWVYLKAGGRGFKAYNYIPSVYDFPYQYLYWWYGKKQYGYHPEVITYLDSVPEYIKDNELFLTQKKPAEDSTIFLIYEPDESPERLYAWLGNFTKYCSMEKQTFNWGTTVELRKLCKS